MSGLSSVFSNNREVIDQEHVAKILYEDATIQDKRGQAGAGIVLANPKRLKILKGRGPARESIRLDRVLQMSDHTVYTGLSYNAYSKSTFLRTEDIHPIPVMSKKNEIYVISDGIVMDKERRRQDLERNGYSIKSDTSAAVIGTEFSRYLDETGDIVEAGGQVIEDHHKSSVFSAILLVRESGSNKTKIVHLRDKTANKPLYIGEGDNTLFANSETFPLQRNGIENIKRVGGGDVVIFSDNGIDTKSFGDPELEYPCVFEIIYFGNPDNLVFDHLGPKFPEYLERLGRKYDPELGPSNFTVRDCLGLAWCDYWKGKVPDPELISAVVTSGTGFTHGVACGYDANPRIYVPTIDINHALKTFQISDPASRPVDGNLKLRYLTDVLNGISILIGDDSIVRGGVGGIQNQEELIRAFFSSRFKLLLGQLKGIGKVRDITMAVSYAPMPFQCFYGFGSMENNAAQDYAGLDHDTICEEVSKKMDPDWGPKGKFRARYNTLENVQNVCGPQNCYACANGIYPIADEFIPETIKNRREIFQRSV
jgi:glutamine phosphoribosylpyrophosphate amidotransferase